MPLRIEGRDEASPPRNRFHPRRVRPRGAVRRASLAGRRRRDDRSRAACRSAARSSGRTRRARSGPDCGCAASCRRSTSTTGSRCCRAGPRTNRGGQNPGCPFAGADLDVQQFDAMGARFTDLKLRMREAPKGWAFDIDGPRGRRHRELVGARRGRAERPDRGAARADRGAGTRQRCVVARADAKESGSDAQADAPAANPWPEIDLAADALISKERDLGRLEFVAQPRGRRLEDREAACSRTKPGSSKPTAHGASPAARSRRSSTSSSTRKDSGAFLARYGYAEGVKGAPTRIDGQLAWTGAPHEFDFNSLNGTFRIHVGPGPIHQARAGPGQAAGRAVAAGAAAARDARLQRRVQRRLRVRRNHRQRADRERRDDARPT